MYGEPAMAGVIENLMLGPGRRSLLEVVGVLRLESSQPYGYGRGWRRKLRTHLASGGLPPCGWADWTEWRGRWGG